MRGLLPYAWRGLAARPIRTLLTVAGIALGVAVLVASLAVNAGLDAAVERTVTSLVGRADVRVSAFAEAGLSEATLSALDGIPGVALTAPAIERRAFLAPEPGRPAEDAPVTVLGIDPSREPRVRDLDLVAGEALDATGESGALVTERLAAASGLAVGSELGILGAGAPVRVVVTGILAGEGPALGSGGRTIVLPITASAALLPDGDVDGDTGTPAALRGLARIDVVLAAGADPDAVVAAVERALVAEPYVLSLPHDIAAAMRGSTADVRATLALLASITLFAAAFLVLNATSMTVVERIRELGLLRAAGAGRGQVVRIVEAQALLLGGAGAVAGIALGLGLAAVLAAGIRAAWGVAIDGPSPSPSILALALGVGVGVTMLAALEPARRASLVSPVAALRARSDPAATARAHEGWVVAVLAATGGLALLVLPLGAASDVGGTRALVIYALLLLAVLVTPFLLGPLSRLAGLPFAVLLRLEERLARAAIGRDRARTMLTVGTLVVGLATVVALGAVGANARATATAWIADVVPGDEILTAIAPAPVGDGGVDEQLADLSGVRSATPIASFDLAFAGRRLEATAVRGADLAADRRLTFLRGDRNAALDAVDRGGAAILPATRAAALGVGLGDTLLVTAQAGPVELRVAGIVERSFPGRTGEALLVGWSDAITRFGVAGADAFAVRYEPGARAGAAPAVRELATSHALTVAPIAAVEGALGDALDRVFGLLDLLALAAVVIAALGIVNTLSMDTWERGRELGMLRAAGMSRAQVWRSVLVEAGILGLIGSVVGAIAGLGVGVVLVASASGGLEGGMIVPLGTIAGAILAGVVLAMVSAAHPARVAGRRSIVAAVAAP
jgi:putative ABC transport system permease protein